MSYTLRSSLLLFQPPAPQVFTHISFGGETILAGTAAVSKTKFFTASGGAVTGGSAVVSKTKTFAASGGASLAGAALTERVAGAPPPAPAPVEARAGPRILLPELPSPRPALVFRYVGEGGLVMGGQAQVRRAWAFVATGELRLGGAAFLELLHVFGGAVAAGGPRPWAGQAQVETAFPVRAWQARARRDEDDLMELGIL